MPWLTRRSSHRASGAGRLGRPGGGLRKTPGAQGLTPADVQGASRDASAHLAVCDLPTHARKIRSRGQGHISHEHGEKAAPAPNRRGRMPGPDAGWQQARWRLHRAVKKNPTMPSVVLDRPFAQINATLASDATPPTMAASAREPRHDTRTLCLSIRPRHGQKGCPLSGLSARIAAADVRRPPGAPHDDQSRHGRAVAASRECPGQRAMWAVLCRPLARATWEKRQEDDVRAVRCSPQRTTQSDRVAVVWE
jgi:hypothetical protein